MRNLKRLKLLTLILLGLITYSCQNQDDYVTGVQEPISEVDTSKLIDFKGLPVPHRFKTNIINLEKDASDKFNFVLKEKRIKHGISYAGKGAKTLDVDKFSKAVDKSFKYFPYQEEGFDMEMIKKDFPTLSEK